MSTMPNGYFLADTNSLVYAYRAGGAQLLDTYFNFARQQGREFAITETVAREIRVGPLKQELGRYIVDKGIKVLDAPKVEHQLKAGQIPRKDAGERSMLEIATSERAAGRTTPIWSDDRFFENRQMMRNAQGAEPVKTSGLLDEMHRQEFITEAAYRRAQVRYQAVGEFQPGSGSFSPRLATFDGPAAHALDHLGVADARFGARPGFQTFVKGTGVAGGALLGYDAVATARHYDALQTAGNSFGADALLHDYVGRTGGGLIAGAASGAAYGLATGSWSGPGALATGAVGGVIGAFGGEAIGRAYTQYQMDHQVGDDGRSYVHTRGQWTESNWIHPGQPAATAQLATLDYKRTTAITEMALANPQRLDTQHITLQDPQGQPNEWRSTPKGWVATVIDKGPDGAEIPVGDLGAVLKHEERASPAVSQQLDQISAARRDANAHYAENLARAYMTDYVGRGFARDDRPVPDSVTKPLNLPSENHVEDPATGLKWERSPQGVFTRIDHVQVPGPAGKEFMAQTLTARGEELARLGQAHQGHVQTNRQFGAALVEQKFQEMQQQQGPQGQRQQPPQQTPARAMDPRDPGHPDHALNEDVRARLLALNAEHGIRMSPEAFDNATGAVMLSAREARMTQVTHMFFGMHDDGRLEPGRVILYQGEPGKAASKINATDMVQAIAIPAEQSYQQAEQTQRQQLAQDHEWRQQLAALEQQNQSQGQGMRMSFGQG